MLPKRFMADPWDSGRMPPDAAFEVPFELAAP